RAQPAGPEEEAVDLRAARLAQAAGGRGHPAGGLAEQGRQGRRAAARRRAAEERAGRLAVREARVHAAAQPMKPVQPVTLADTRVRLEPLGMQHVDGLKSAAADGELWNLRYTSVPDPDDTAGYIERAQQGHAEGHRLAFAVIEVAT